MEKLHMLLSWRAILLLTSAATACCGLASSPARADEKADALLAKAKTAYKAATSLTASVTITVKQGSGKFAQTETLQLRKPNLARILMASPQKMSVMSDGKNVYTLMADHQYVQQPADPRGLTQAESLGGLPVSLFFGHDTYGLGKLSDGGVQKLYAGKETVGGVAYDVLTISGKTPFVHTLRIYIGSNGLIGRSVSDITVQSGTIVQTYEWKDQKLDALPATTSFAVALPKDAKPFKAPAAEDYAAKLVAIGKLAPVFALPTPTGGIISLADSTADHKAVLVNFWFYG